MRFESEIKNALDVAKSHIAAIEGLSCPSEQTAAYKQLPEFKARATAFQWVLEGDQQLAYLHVDSTLTAAFQHYLDHYHDQEEEALDEAAKEHYQDWLDTCEPGDEYVVSENDHSLDPIEPRFEVVQVEESEYGKFYHLTFPSISTAMQFGLGWGEVKGQKLEKQANAGLAQSLDEALNRGDGTYRP